MKQTSIQKIALLVLTGVLIFTSCEKDEITSISFDKESLNLNVGLSDTSCTIQYTVTSWVSYRVATERQEWGIWIHGNRWGRWIGFSKHTLTKNNCQSPKSGHIRHIDVGGKPHSCKNYSQSANIHLTKSITGWEIGDIEPAFDILIENFCLIDLQGTGATWLNTLNITNRLSTGNTYLRRCSTPGFRTGRSHSHEGKDDFDVAGSHLMEFVSEKKILIWSQVAITKLRKRVIFIL